MKKYFFAIAAIVLAIGFSAFTTKAPSKSSKADPLYYWLATSDNGTPLDFVIDAEGDSQQEVADVFLDCDGGDNYCAIAYSHATDDRVSDLDFKKSE
jgi:hypothetical protein